MAVHYTPNQLENYLERIGYGASETGSSRITTLEAGLKSDTLATIAQLQRLHLSSIPWGNSALHYSQHHSISTHPSAVFEKLVIRRLDGYCMETTNLFYVVLRSFGLQVYPTAGRVSSAATDPKNGWRDVRYGSLSHMVIILTLDGRKYMVDVGFGNNCPTAPLLLEDTLEPRIVDNLPPAQMTVVKQPLPEAVDQSQKFWIYKVRFDSKSVWVPFYAFSETEFLPEDFAMMNLQTSKLPSSCFTQRVLGVRHLFSKDENRLTGMVIMSGNEVKSRKNGETELLETLEGEEARVKALKNHFGVALLDHEVAGIKGLGSELR
ncbi:hypothetical protein BDV18DRAFT_134920 [Aspergillus unguis]